MAVACGSWSVWQSAFLVFWVFALKCAAMDLATLEQKLGDGFLRAMEQAGITVKAAALTCGMDESTFRKALRGESYRHLTLIHAVQLGPLFMVHLSASLLWLTAKEHGQQILDTVNVRKGA